jgi:hypothetical protein
MSYSNRTKTVDNSSERGIVAEIESIDIDTEKWDIFHKNGDLCIAHFKCDPEHKPDYSQLRGSVYDLKRKIKVASSLPYVPIIITDEIPNTSIFTMKDDHNISHKFEKSKMTLLSSPDCATFRIIRHNGKNYMLHAKSLSGESGTWGTSKTFGEMWENVLAPPLSSFFDETKKYSSWMYEVSIVCPSLIFGSKDDVGRGYMIFQNATQVYTKEAFGSDHEEVDFERRFTEEQIKKFELKVAVEYTLSQANNVLSHGLPCCPKDDDIGTDPRIKSGSEAVLIKNGSQLFRIYDTSYQWRANMRGGVQDIKQRFYFLLSVTFDLFEKKDFATYESKFIMLSHLPMKSIQELSTLDNIPSANQKEIDKMKSNLQSIIYNTWLNFVISLPIGLQRSGLKLLTVYTGDKSELSKIIFQTYKSNAKKITHPRIDAITSYLKKTMKNADRKYTFDQNLKYYIKLTLDNESPNSIFTMLNPRTGLKRHLQKI